MGAQTIEISAPTLEEARAKLQAKVPAGQSVLSEEILSDGKERRLEGVGETRDAAYKKVEATLPPESKIIEKRDIKAACERFVVVAGEDEFEARGTLMRAIGKTELVLDLQILEKGKKGYLGIGRKPTRFRARVLEQAVVQVRWKSIARVSAKVGYRNRGDFHGNLSRADAYWNVRIGSVRQDPYLMYTFSKESNARTALLDVPCIHDDDGSLVCTEALIYGYYWTEDSLYEVVLCGDDLTIELWELAKESFERRGGQRKNDLRPTNINSSARAGDGDASKVVFVREDVQGFPANVYRVHKGPDEASAMAFLDLNPVTQSLHYVVVETPDGVFCRDKSGFYKE